MTFMRFEVWKAEKHYVYYPQRKRCRPPIRIMGSWFGVTATWLTMWVLRVLLPALFLAWTSIAKFTRPVIYTGTSVLENCHTPLPSLSNDQM
ncbi:hypothetical protein FHL15_008988 [Xylaria flabelliformis]|uniref:Uncharacterized protein n=1 Tax=Xylaria flabelliformis TaxID=2512241 RepID=A0A553HQ59_9PEZI|nr:hypothetical protein FHL15_008988 [Xylaria flabelliformis]